ncbi:MAG: hypothetical protein COA88_05230 [Kordia sp.]|nr:MAG: hypothetical protein COA88_05230 [Kordia sp.]
MGSGGDFSNAGAMKLSVAGNDDIVLSNIEAAPSVTVTNTYLLLMDNDFDGVASPGDTIRHTIVMTNTDDTFDAPVSGVFLNSGIDANANLVVGSVTTMQGTVTTGNMGGNTSISINIGSIADTITVTYDVLINSPFSSTVFQISNQGTVTSNDLVGGVITDYPASGGNTDPTIIPITQSIIGDFVWSDINNDGVQNGGAELGISGITLDAYFDVDNSNTISGGDIFTWHDYYRYQRSLFFWFTKLFKFSYRCYRYR